VSECTPRARRAVCRTALALLAISGTAAAGDWQQIGLDGRPSWVDAKVERRLRLLPALAGIENTLTTQADAYLADKGPGLAVGLVLDDGLYYSHGFGFRDASKTKKPDEQTVFCIGSFTKVFTGTTLLVLRDAGKVSFADLASKYVPEIKDVRDAPCPGGGCEGKVRLRHLVSHTSGLPNEMSPAVVGQTEWLQELSRTRLNLWPGTFSAYSGVGVEMAGLVVERVSGKSYRKAVKDLLLEPLNMNQSTFDMDSVPASRRAQNWKLSWNAGFTAPRFTADSTWTDRKMLTAAGYLLSSIRDLARFDRIWLAQKAPSDILKEATLADARTPLESASTGAIPSNCDSFDDGAGSSYTDCGNATDFGVNWFIAATPYIKHNGSTGLCGSSTVLNPDKKLGASGLISTDPFPKVPDGETQPTSVDNGFMDNVVMDMVTAGVAADTASDWQGKPLAVGVARYLWVLGAKMPSSMIERRLPPRGRRGAPLNVGQSSQRTTSRREDPEAKAFTEAFLSHFTGGYRKLHKLDEETVASYVVGLRSDIGACSTFRVRKAPGAHKVTLRLRCEEGTVGGHTAYDATLTVESDAPYRIAAIENQGPSEDPY
jgi:CubicO group peptidase (beta-lactamase class C family)